MLGCLLLHDSHNLFGKAAAESRRTSFEPANAVSTFGFQETLRVRAQEQDSSYMQSCDEELAYCFDKSSSLPIPVPWEIQRKISAEECRGYIFSSTRSRGARRPSKFSYAPPYGHLPFRSHPTLSQRTNLPIPLHVRLPAPCVYRQTHRSSSART